MDVLLPECRYLYPGLKFAARIKQWRQALALPADAATFLLEVVKFLATAALILASALVMLMTG